MSMESGKTFLKPEQFEREAEEQEAVKKAEEEANKAGRPFGVLDKEIARLEAKRQKVSENLKLSPNAPALQELDAQIQRLKEEK